MAKVEYDDQVAEALNGNSGTSNTNGIGEGTIANDERPITLLDLAPLRMWVAWQEEEAPGAQPGDPPRKVPWRPNGTKRADVTNSEHRGTLEQARMRADALSKPFGKGGVGTVLTDIGGGLALIGI